MAANLEPVSAVMARFAGEKPQRLELLLPVACMPCPRPRAVRGRGAYYPERYSQWRELAQGALMEACSKSLGALRPLWAEDVYVELTCYGARGDVDNLLKSVMDALQGIVVVDDKQVRQAEVSSWSVDGMGKQTFVIVELLAKGDDR